MLRPKRYFAILVVTAGCGGAASSNWLATAEGDTSVPAQPPPAVGEVRLELIDGGSEPRSPLRYDLRAVRPDRMLVDMKMDVSTPHGRGNDDWVGDMWIARPTTRLSSLVEPLQLSPEGNLVYRIVTERMEILKDATVDSEVRAQMKAQMKPVVGLPSEAVVTPRGIARRVEVSSPFATGQEHELSQAMEIMGAMMRQMLMPFPAEPVGIGAKWKTISTIQAKDFPFVEVKTFKLISRERESAVVDFEYDERSQAPDILTLVDAAPDATMVLESHEGHGTGRVTIDFGRLIARGEQQCERHGHFWVRLRGERSIRNKSFRLKYKFGPR